MTGVMPDFGEVPGVIPGSSGAAGPLCPSAPDASPGLGGAEPAAVEVSGVAAAVPGLCPCGRRLCPPAASFPGPRSR